MGDLSVVSNRTTLNRNLHTGPVHQIQSYYRRGMPDNCQNVIEDLKICMQIKLLKISEPDEAKVRASDSCGRRERRVGRRWT
jgi:hypothetical protein